MNGTSGDRGAPVLSRSLGVGGSVMMGLGSIVGTGVFVSIGMATGIAGPSVILAVMLAAVLAVCNGMSSAQLAASHAVSGGTYEYGYRYLNSWLGFTAGWLFLLAKSASAATAALGLSGYLLGIVTRGDVAYLVPVALAAVGVLTIVVLSGLRRSNTMNIAIVSVALGSLLFFLFAGTQLMAESGGRHLRPFFQSDDRAASIFHTTALMFVAYTGYGRIATLGEEVRDPRRTIPRAILMTMVVTMVLYTAVAVVGVGAVGSETLSGMQGAESAAPLVVAARRFHVPRAALVMAVGAIAAMLGVLLNLILGLSRVLLAMGRRGDMPHVVARLDKTGSTPYVAVIVMGIVVALLVLAGDVKTTWSFSAFTVLIYYGITNLAALRLPKEQRLYPAWIAVVGLVGCPFLAFWMDRSIWAPGLGVIALGLLWHAMARRLRGRSR
jgi:APA family basic amino acid/polyamine antiporter